MLNLPRETFNLIKRKLLRQQREVEMELKSIQKDDPLRGDGHLAESSEPGTDSWLAEVHIRVTALKQNLQNILEKTRDSLAKLKSGKYGKCENCGKMIEIQRLLAMPTATLCLSCSKKVKK